MPRVQPNSRRSACTNNTRHRRPNIPNTAHNHDALRVTGVTPVSQRTEIRRTRIGDKTLRGCPAEVHDDFVRDLNVKYRDAVKAGS